MTSIRVLLLTALSFGALLIVPGGALATDLYLAGGDSGDPMIKPTTEPPDVDAESYEAGPITLLDSDNGTLTCEEVELQAVFVTKPRESFRLTAPHPSSTEDFSGCTYVTAAEQEIETEITPNGCGFRYENFEHVAGPEYQAEASIECWGEDEIEISVSVCKMSIPEQSLNQDATLTHVDSEGEHLRAETSGSGLTYSTDTPFACEFGGIEEGPHEDASAELDLLVKDATLTGGVAKVVAAEYPKEIIGERYEDGVNVGKLMVLDTAAGPVSCDAVEVDGGTISAPAYSLTMDPTYSECLINEGSSATVTMNSCRYVTSELEGYLVDEYAFEVSIDCTEEGDEIEIGLPAGCTVGVPEQSLNDDSIAANRELQGQKAVGLAINGSGMVYESQSGKFACALAGISEGVHEDGESEQFFLLR